MNTDPVFLTNGCCENAGVIGARTMERLGLEFGEFEGFFYPLTDREARYVGTDRVAIGDSGSEAWLSFSMLYGKRKWLSPVVEIRYRQDVAGDALPDRATAQGATRRIYAQIIERTARVGGHALMAESDDRFWIEMMLPFELAMGCYDFDGWKRFLEHEFFAGISAIGPDHRRPAPAPLRCAAGAAA